MQHATIDSEESKRGESGDGIRAISPRYPTGNCSFTAVEDLFSGDRGNVPVQRPICRPLNRLLAECILAALSETLEDVYATIRRGRNGQGS